MHGVASSAAGMHGGQTREVPVSQTRSPSPYYCEQVWGSITPKPSGLHKIFTCLSLKPALASRRVVCRQGWHQSLYRSYTDMRLQ